MRKYLSLAVVLALAACGGAESGGGGPGSSSSSSGGGADSGSGGAGGGGGSGGAGGVAPASAVAGEATTIHDCAPDDGPAFTIKIGLPEKTCVATPSGPFLRLSFYTHVDAPAGNMWTFASAVGEAQGIYQPDSADPSNLVVVTSGTLQVTTWDMVAAKGSYDVILIDGTHLAGSFDALACLQTPALCG